MTTNEPPKAQTVPELVRELQKACECFQDGVIFCDERFDDLRLGVKKNNRLLWSICDAFLSQEAEIARLRGALETYASCQGCEQNDNGECTCEDTYLARQTLSPSSHATT